MVLFNYAIREVTAKLVYYGPGLCGKTTNLQFIHEKLDPSARGKLLSLATDGDRTLFFDFLPIEMGSIGGFKVRFQLYTVPGQVHYNATRKLVLKGVDAVAFVADSQISMLERNRESFQNLVENLIENGYDPAKIPIVIQLNKRDLPDVASIGDLVSVMGVEGYPVCEAVASRGDGVFETLKTIVKLTLSRLRIQFEGGSSAGGDVPRAEAPPPPPPPPSAVFSPPPSPPPPPVPVPVPETTAVQRLEVESGDPDATADGLDEFDLEYFSDEKAAPVESGTPEPAFEEMFSGDDVLDLEADMETLIDGQGVPGPDVLDATGPIDTGDFAESQFEETGVEDDWPAATPPSDADVPRGATDTYESPPWAVELLEEMRQLRAENGRLREALHGILTLLDRQIGVLQEGRDELDRHVGEIPGESES